MLPVDPIPTLVQSEPANPTGDPVLSFSFPCLRRLPLFACLAAAAALLLTGLPAPQADASGYGRFQVGGRGVAQVGAFVARADDPHAVTYNPAGITELDGLQLAGGLDFSNATDELDFRLGSPQAPPGTTFRADHSIQFPPSVYVTWSDRERLGRWSLGLGVDTPFWYRVDFDPVFFPLRELARLNELELWQLHPVAAYRLGDRWSVGGGLRYQWGSTTWGRNRIQGVAPAPGGPLLPVEYFQDAEADVDGFGFDLGAQFRSTLWGFGALYRSGVELEGSDDLSFAVRDAAPEVLEPARAILAARPGAFDATVQNPAELHAGAWFAPYPELRIEVDLALVSWADAEQVFSIPAANGVRTPVNLMAGFDDTVSVRLGLEGDLSDFVALSGGVAWEPSPVPEERTSSAWPRGDATVYAVGASFRYDRVRFDLGYSFHDYEEREVVDPFPGTGQPPLPTPVEILGTFSSDVQVWSVSARYTF